MLSLIDHRLNYLTLTFSSCNITLICTTDTGVSCCLSSVQCYISCLIYAIGIDSIYLNLFCKNSVKCIELIFLNMNCYATKCIYGTSKTFPVNNHIFRDIKVKILVKSLKSKLWTAIGISRIYLCGNCTSISLSYLKECITVDREKLNLLCIIIDTSDYYSIASTALFQVIITGINSKKSYISIALKFFVNALIYFKFVYSQIIYVIKLCILLMKINSDYSVTKKYDDNQFK